MDMEHADRVANTIAGIRAMNLSVFGKRVAVVRDPSEEKVGLLYIPEEGKRKEPRGTIVALGRDIEAEDDVEVGYRVLFTKYAPIHFTITLPTGEKSDIELMHMTDIYMGWPSGANEVGQHEDLEDADGS